MGILNALQTAVTGLSAQSYALENISGNIANSQTVGFKRVDTSFVDLIPESPARHEVGGLRRVVLAADQYDPGDAFEIDRYQRPTWRSTATATSRSPRRIPDRTARPTFSGEQLYTRRGDFQTDANGYLVNGSGKYLVGSVVGLRAIPRSRSRRRRSRPSRPRRDHLSGRTCRATPRPPTRTASVAGSEHSRLVAGVRIVATVSGADNATFMNESIAGGEVSVYNTVRHGP